MPRRIDMTPKPLLLRRHSDSRLVYICDLQGRPLLVTPHGKGRSSMFDVRDADGNLVVGGDMDAIMHTVGRFEAAGRLRVVPADETIDFDGPRLNPPLEDALAEIGVAQEVAERVLAETDRAAQGRMVALLRRQPDTTVEALETAAGAVKQKRAPTQYETTQGITWSAYNNGTYDAELAGWFTYQLVKYRVPGQGSGAVATRMVTGLRMPAGLHDEETRQDLAHEIRDWYRDVSPQLASYSWEQAVAASDAWHAEQAKKGAGRGYDGSQKTIFKWPDGGKMVELRSKNDYEVEGHADYMNICVGSYWGRDLTILSLRDPQNKPHVTIEVNIEGKGREKRWNVQQIKGRSNSVPKAEYAARVRDFFSKRNAYTESDGWRDVWQGDPRRFAKDLAPAASGERNEYGLISAVDLPSLREAGEALDNAWSRGHSDWTYPGDDVADFVGELGFREDIESTRKRLGPRHRVTWADLDFGTPRDGKGKLDSRTELRWLFDKLDETEMEWKRRWEPYDYPKQEEDESEEDYEARREKWEEEEDGPAFLDWLRDGPYSFYENVLEGYETAARAARVKDVPERKP